MLEHNEKYQILAKYTIKANQTPIKAKANTEDQINKLKSLEYFCGNSQFIYDYQLLENLLDHSQLLTRLTPDALLRIIGKQQKYSYLKKFAIERLEEMIWRQLNLLYNINHCHNSYEEPDEETTQQIFNWSLEEFSKRRNLQDFVWIDVLKKFPQRCLQKYKFKKDLEQLQKYVQYIFGGLLSKREDENIVIKRQVLLQINNLKHLLEMFHNMEQEFLDNTNILKGLLQKQLLLTNIKRDGEKRLTAIFLHTKLANSHIWDAIENRYCQKWCRSNVNQNQYRINNIQQSLERDIENYQSRTIVENACSNNCMDYFYSAIEHLKTTINEIQLKFDTVSEEMENNLSYKRLQIDKLCDQRQWLSTEIKRFHEETEAMRIRQEREAEERERLRLEEEEVAAQISEKNQNKRK